MVAREKAWDADAAAAAPRLLDDSSGGRLCCGVNHFMALFCACKTRIVKHSRHCINIKWLTARYWDTGASS
jgi:hypothetical protein